MNISLTPELDSYVQEKVHTGMYHSASEVVRAGLRLLRVQDQLRQARLDQLRSDIDVGIDQMEHGEFTQVSAEGVGDLSAKIKSKGRELLSARQGVRL
jgi:antitoxin ParD1/3/4